MHAELTTIASAQVMYILLEREKSLHWHTAV